MWRKVSWPSDGNYRNLFSASLNPTIKIFQVIEGKALRRSEKTHCHTDNFCVTVHTFLNLNINF